MSSCRESACPETVAALQRLDWRRNNVRELKNVVERMVIACPDDKPYRERYSELVGEENILDVPHTAFLHRGFFHPVGA